MAKYVKKEPTLTITVNKTTRQVSVVVSNWEGVSPGMLGGMELAIEKAVHAWKLAHTSRERVRVDGVAVDVPGRSPVSQTFIS